MVFRRDNKVDAFQRQMSALRQQLGGPEDEQRDEQDESYTERDRYAGQAGQGEYAPADAGGYSFGAYQPATTGIAAPLEPEQPVVPEFPAVDSQVSVIAQDTFWKGDLESEGSMHVHGRVEGNLRAKEDVWVADGADVSATISARRVVIAGQVGGTVRAIERFEALPQARVAADVHAPTFVVHEGAMINGQLHMASGQGGEGRTNGSPAIIQRRAARPGA